MSELSATDLAGWRHYHIQGEPVDTAGLPFSERFLDGQFPAVIPEAQAENFAVSSQRLGWLSIGHGRSYQIETGVFDEGDQFQQTALWRDSYGNLFTALYTKGNNFTRAKVFESLTAPSGYIPYGLMEGDALLRVLRSSRVLRELGVDTEWVVRIMEPKQLLYEGKLVSQDEYKKQIVQKAMLESKGFDEAAKIASAIGELDFYVTLRAMRIGDRPTDLLFDTTREAVLNRMRKVFSVYNQTQQQLRGFSDDFESLSVDNPEHLAAFFEDFYPILLASNLSTLHKAGLMHTFPTPGNTNLLGGLIDLDSVKGEPLGLGDNPVTVKQWGEDINRLFTDDDSHGLESIYIHLEDLGILENGFVSLTRATSRFMKTYFEAQGLGEVTADNATAATELITAVEYEFVISVYQDILNAHLPSYQEDNQYTQAYSKLVDSVCIAVLDDVPRFTERALDDFVSQLEKCGLSVETEAPEFMEQGAKHVEEIKANILVYSLSDLGPVITEAAKPGGMVHDWFTEYGVAESLRPLLTNSLQLRALEEGTHLYSPENTERPVAAIEQAIREYALVYNKAVDEDFIEQHAPSFAAVVEKDNTKYGVRAAKPISFTENLPLQTLLNCAEGSSVVLDRIAPEEEDALCHIRHDINGQQLKPRAVFIDGSFTEIGWAYQNQRVENEISLYDLEKASYVAWLTDPDEHGVVHLVISQPATVAER